MPSERPEAWLIRVLDELHRRHGDRLEAIDEDFRARAMIWGDVQVSEQIIEGRR